MQRSGYLWCTSPLTRPDLQSVGLETKRASGLWSITTGERLVGPFKHDRSGTRFFPNDDYIATAKSGVLPRRSIRIFDSRNSDELTINIYCHDLVTPLA